MLARHCFVDNRRAGSVCAVLLGESPALDQPHSHGTKIAGTYNPENGISGASGVSGCAPLNGEISGEQIRCAIPQGPTRCNPGALRTRQRFDGANSTIEERSNLTCACVLRVRQPNLKTQHMLRPEAQVDILQAPV